MKQCTIVIASMEIVIMSPDFVRLWDTLKRLREIKFATPIHTHAIYAATHSQTHTLLGERSKCHTLNARLCQ